MPVPSPTYLLHNSYEACFPPPGGEDSGERGAASVHQLHHLDLYRLQGEQDMARLDMQQLCSTGAVVASSLRRAPGFASGRAWRDGVHWWRATGPARSRKPCAVSDSELYTRAGVCLIEWAVRMPTAPSPAVRITFDILNQVRGHASCDSLATQLALHCVSDEIAELRCDFHALPLGGCKTTQLPCLAGAARAPSRRLRRARTTVCGTVGARATK